MIPAILIVLLQKYISSLQVYIPYIRTTLRYSNCLLGSQRYLWIFTGSGTEMRLSKQNSIVYYGDQKPLINRNCQNQLMFLQGEQGCRSDAWYLGREVVPMSGIQEGIGPMFQCIMGNGRMGTSSCGQNDKQTDACENITFSWVVIKT